MSCDKFNNLGKAFSLHLNTLTKQFISRSNIVRFHKRKHSRRLGKGFLSNSNLFKSIFNTLFIIPSLGCVEKKMKKPQTETDSIPHLVNLWAFITCSTRNFPWQWSRGRRRRRKTWGNERKNFRPNYLFVSEGFFSVGRTATKKCFFRRKKRWNSTRTRCATKYARDNKLKLTDERRFETEN